MLLCLPKIPDWSNKKLDGQLLGSRGIGWAGGQREYVGGEREGKTLRTAR